MRVSQQHSHYLVLAVDQSTSTNSLVRVLRQQSRSPILAVDRTHYNQFAAPCRYGLYILVGLVVPLGVFMVYGAFNRGSSPAPGTLVLWFGLAG